MAGQTGTASNLEDLVTKIYRFLLGFGTAGAPGYTGTGNGTMTGVDTFVATVSETWTITCTATAANGGTFSVVGSVSGAQANATVGTPYSNSFIKFTINDGTADFILGDAFTVVTTAGVMPTLERWTALRVFRDNLSTVSLSSLTESTSVQNRKAIHTFRYDSRSLNINNTTSAHSYFSGSSFVAGTSMVTMTLRQATEIKKVLLAAPNSSSDISFMLRNYRLQYADSLAGPWTTALTVSGAANFAPNETRTTTVPGTPGAHLYWRFILDSNQAGSSTTITWKTMLLLDALDLPANHFGSEIIFKATGIAGDDNIYTGLRSEYDSANDWYNLFFNGYSGFDTNEMSWFEQPGSLPGYGDVDSFSTPMVPCINSSMLYWIRASGRSMALGVKVSTSYEGAYMGFGLPFCAPTEYPYPLVIGGSLVPIDSTRAGEWRFSTSSCRHSVFPIAGSDNNATATTGSATLYIKLPDGNWGKVAQRGNTSDPNAILDMSISGVPPFSMSGTIRGVWPTTSRDIGASGRRRDYRDVLGGGYMFQPLIIHQRLPSPEVLCKLEGVYAVSGFSNAAENTTTYDSKSHVILQNVTRTDPHEYWAMEFQ